MRVPRAFLEEAKARCKPEAECAALLFGRGGDVLKWRWAEAEADKYSFRIGAEEVYRAVTDAEAEGLELIAIFHSHPVGSRPSSVDAKYMRLWPVAWIIMDASTGEARAWRLGPQGLEEIPIYPA
ncbi:MAG: Mov34/MPN/PAD-1 family protein [Thermoproteus sp. AZ2]|jgi:proteasome lid subunit RPN8/RPN11|uniref:Mov34/MPN/PAD-1 family protein n=1 Tax=Thermoproteus sp. AZ2 TaxID=1609232 RepID=A0ACC6V302_9CREN|nr:MAG: peptidase [Thermoproteus sp. AZ2]